MESLSRQADARRRDQTTVQKKEKKKELELAAISRIGVSALVQPALALPFKDARASTIRHSGAGEHVTALSLRHLIQ